jgi:hypothetical protein
MNIFQAAADKCSVPTRDQDGIYHVDDELSCLFYCLQIGHLGLVKYFPPGTSQEAKVAFGYYYLQTDIKVFSIELTGEGIKGEKIACVGYLPDSPDVALVKYAPIADEDAEIFVLSGVRFAHIPRANSPDINTIITHILSSQPDTIPARIIYEPVDQAGRLFEATHFYYPAQLRGHCLDPRDMVFHSEMRHRQVLETSDTTEGWWKRVVKFVDVVDAALRWTEARVLEFGEDFGASLQWIGAALRRTANVLQWTGGLLHQVGSVLRSKRQLRFITSLIAVGLLGYYLVDLR